MTLERLRNEPHRKLFADVLVQVSARILTDKLGFFYDVGSCARTHGPRVKSTTTSVVSSVRLVSLVAVDQESVIQQHPSRIDGRDGLLRQVTGLGDALRRMLRRVACCVNVCERKLN
jgi:hypothetical protein